MALALDYGALSEHEKTRFMSSVYSLDSPTEPQAPGQTSEPPDLGFDGASDRKSVVSNEHGKQHEAHDFFRQRKQIPAPLSDICSSEHEHIQASGTISDPNFARRKRRRATPSNQTSLTAFVGLKSGGDAQQTQCDLKPVARINGETSSGISEADQSPVTSLDQEEVKQSTRTIPKRGRAIASRDIEKGGTTTNKLTASKKRTPRKQTPLSNIAGSIHEPSSQTLHESSVSIKNIASKSYVSRKSMKMRNGKFVHTFEIILRYGHDLGEQISTILSKPTSDGLTIEPHPFFSGNPLAKDRHGLPKAANDTSRVDDADQDGQTSSAANGPIAWNEIKFSNPKGAMFKSSEAIRAIWPPNQLQHIGQESPDITNIVDDVMSCRQTKMKTKAHYIDDTEDVLHLFAKFEMNKPTGECFRKPERRLMSGNDLAKVVRYEPASLMSSSLRSKMAAMIEHGSSAFDRGEPSGQQNWTVKYAPTKFQDVLQPSCQIFRDWLKDLAVHNVQKGGVDGDRKHNDQPTRKKRRQKRAIGELDDFIVDDDDNDDDHSVGRSVKNAVLIMGPSGCGKTASVFAVAKELNFEVFEIHPGMRRSAKDIFDKVGDMTQNHLVQQTDAASRSSSVAPIEPDTTVPSTKDSNQSSLTGFLGSKKTHGIQTTQSKLSNTTASTKKEQKQSLILFEEVDILFESDKGFWSGVQSLIRQSKRPVVMTCNDISQIPVSELDLFTILEYEIPAASLVTEYLIAMCASEGHIVKPGAVHNVFISKGKDLRASIAELSFWCQMTVGSEKGGLDWMFSSVPKEPRFNAKGEKLRICSDSTYHLGLDIFPENLLNVEQSIRHCTTSLALPITQWLDICLPGQTKDIENTTTLSQLDETVHLSEARSVLDIFDEDAASFITSTIMIKPSDDIGADFRERVTNMWINRVQTQEQLQPINIVDAFDAMTIVKPTFPPSQGRLAPSIDACSTSLVVDVAPYVRAIVSFDKQLEQQREELFGSQGKKSRNTRAARAAAEGGDKAHTRADRWFPKQLDLERVLETGNNWPLWLPNDRHEELENAMEVDRE